MNSKSLNPRIYKTHSNPESFDRIADTQPKFRPFRKDGKNGAWNNEQSKNDRTDA